MPSTNKTNHEPSANGSRRIRLFVPYSWTVFPQQETLAEIERKFKEVTAGRVERALVPARIETNR